MKDFLSLNDINLIERQGERIKSQLRHFINLLPHKARTMGGLALWIGVSRSTSQRLIQVINPEYSGSDVIAGLPSPQGFNQFLTAIESKPDNQEMMQALESAANTLHKLLTLFNCTHNQLKQRLKQHDYEQNANSKGLEEASAKSIYQMNCEIHQESIELSLGIDCVKVNSDDPQYLSEVVIANRRGVKLNENARPFVQSFVGNDKNYTINKPVVVTSSQIPGFDIKSHPQFLLADFSTPQIEELFIGHGKQGNCQIFDMARSLSSSINNTQTPNEEADTSKAITLGHYDATSEFNPLQTSKSVLIHGMECRYPTKRLLLISLLEKQLAIRSIAKTGNYSSNATAQEAGYLPEEIWNDRLTVKTTLESFDPWRTKLNQSFGVSGIDEMVENALHLNQLSRQECVGYYLLVDYPIWLTTHRIYFEFA